ncbi:MAG: aminotransferase class I/II-fold pyridoxal phosphate-dependent enzyme [Nannocystaceae bacterium]
MSRRLDQRLTERAAALDRAGLTRTLPRITERRGVRYQLEGRPVVGFCSNDYLGFADEPDAPPTVAAGTGASRLICGDLPELRHLEEALADLVDAEAVVLFPSGFQLNAGVLPALVEPGDLVFSDRLNHASLIDGLRLSRASTQILPHGAAPPHEGDSRGPLRWWITESIFSMDGDRVDFAAAADFVARGGSLYVDEAHSFGLFDGGSTLCRSEGLRPSLLIGTLGKAVGAAGAFVAASSTICRWLRTRARSFVFTTGTSPRVAQAALHRIGWLRGELGERRRGSLWANIARMSANLGAPEPWPSPIFPLVVGDNHRALAIADALLDRGWHVQAIRPPTVPEGGARLRLTLSALHEAADIDALTEDLRRIFARFEAPLEPMRAR